MKTFRNMAAQGDLLLIRVAELPDGAVPVPATDGKHIVAHSETGHHHTIAEAEAVVYADPQSKGMEMFVQIMAGADLIHERPHDTHETIRIPAGIFKMRRQREYTPEGLRRVED